MVTDVLIKRTALTYFHSIAELGSPHKTHRPITHCRMLSLQYREMYCYNSSHSGIGRFSVISLLNFVFSLHFYEFFTNFIYKCYVEEQFGGVKLKYWHGC